jgi:hypothetical protein
MDCKITVNDRYILIKDHETFIIYRDKFDRKWRLDIVKNEKIMMPFIITPLPKE